MATKGLGPNWLQSTRAYVWLGFPGPPWLQEAGRLQKIQNWLQKAQIGRRRRKLLASNWLQKA